MRKSRQPRCTAVISFTAAAATPEAAGRKPEFELSDSSRIIAGTALPVVQTSRMARS
jgi:hypothetical protein